jgi:hypothetical protein
VREALQTVPIGPDAVEAALAREQSQEHGAARAALAEVEARLATLVQRKVTLTVLLTDGTIDAEAYQGTLAKTEAETKELRTRRTALEQSLVQSTAAQASLQQTADWVRSQTDWTALLEHATHDEQRTIYRECIARIAIDAPAGTLTVVWTPPIAQLTGAASYTAVLTAQPRTRLVVPKVPDTTVALIQQLASAQPRPTARQVQEQLGARGITVSQRTIQRYAAVTPAKRGRPAKRA